MDYNIPWLNQDNDYLPVFNALTYLKSLGVSKEFSGGFIADRNIIQELIIASFWLGRCNASLPGIYFTGINSSAIFNICKDGNLHIECYENEEMHSIRKIAIQLGFLEVTSVCRDHFEEAGAKTGREISV